MKTIMTLILGILIISCSPKKENQSADENATSSIERSENFDWLLGQWTRSNEEEGKETFENWNKVSDTEYAGIGYTMQAADTIWQEQMQLVKVDGNWDLLVKTPDESETTTFKGSDHNETEFTCENQEIDFPNKIKYSKNGDKIFATVSGDEMQIDFEFERISL